MDHRAAKIKFGFPSVALFHHYHQIGFIDLSSGAIVL